MHVLIMQCQQKGTSYQYKACLACGKDTLHRITRYAKATANLKLYHFVCLYCHHEGEE